MFRGGGIDQPPIDYSLRGTQSSKEGKKKKKKTVLALQFACTRLNDAQRKLPPAVKRSSAGILKTRYY